MKKILFLLILLCIEKALHAQQPYIYTIKADSVKITNTCDTAELIIENHTQNVPGFLFNKGRGRTEFRKVVKLNDSTLVLGNDTVVILGNTLANNGLSITDRHVQLGQSVGVAGNPAALTNNREIPLNAKNLLFTGEGKIGIGTTSPDAKLEVATSSGNPAFRISDGTYETDFIQNGYISTIAASSSFKVLWNNEKSLFFLEDGPPYSGKFLISGIYGAFINGFGGFSVRHDERFGFLTHGSTTNYNAIGSVHIDNYNSGLTFFIKRDSVESELVRFTHTGNVGIGTSSPVDRLHVSGTVRITDTLKMPNIIVKSDTASYKPLVVDGNGNVFKMNSWNVSTSRKSATITGSSYTVPADIDVIFVNYTAGQATITLPTGTLDREITIKNLHTTNTVILSGLDTSESNSIATRGAITVKYTGSSWVGISKY